jgi:hypothetical protein
LLRSGGVGRSPAPALPPKGGLLTNMAMSALFAEGDFRVGRVINQSISVLSRRFVTLFTIAAAAYLPTFLIGRWMFSFLSTSMRVPGRAEQIAYGVFLSVVFILFSLLGQAMIVHAAFQDIHRRPVSLSASVKVGLRRFRHLFGIAILFAALIWLSFALFIELTSYVWPSLLLLTPIPIAVIVTVYFVTTPACVVEERGPFGSMGRSAQLTKRHRWRIFGLELLLMALLLITGILIGLLNWALSAIGGPLLAIISGVLWNIVWVAYYAVMVAVAYHDLRVAKEGIDIEQVASVFD